MRSEGFDFMRRRLMLIAVAAPLVWGCGDDRTNRARPGFDPGPSPAGSCHYEAQGTCDEYAENDADQTTAANCVNAGGAWTAGKCPFDARTGLCTLRDTATRTYSYTVEAASTLQASCPERFIAIESDDDDMYVPPMSTPDAAMPLDDDGGA
jgi:hypothetical protein